MSFYYINSNCVTGWLLIWYGLVYVDSVWLLVWYGLVYVDTGWLLVWYGLVWYGICWYCVTVGMVWYTSIYIAWLSKKCLMCYTHLYLENSQVFRRCVKETKSCCVVRSSGKVPNHRGYTQRMFGDQQWRAGVVAPPSIAVWLTGDATHWVPTVVGQAIDEWRLRLPACVQAKGISSCTHWN